MLIKFIGINFSGFEPAQKLIPLKINQLYSNLIALMCTCVYYYSLIN